jgi:hypothetical protein
MVPVSDYLNLSVRVLDVINEFFLKNGQKSRQEGWPTNYMLVKETGKRTPYYLDRDNWSNVYHILQETIKKELLVTSQREIIEKSRYSVKFPEMKLLAVLTEFNVFEGKCCKRHCNTSIIDIGGDKYGSDS